ncbi:hypothetical protein L0V05_15765 [Tabrizicola sp. J26]|uniref:hypothetical protein n=1 Tax=Alitabrizicola rongguiensis TaxID=2909234 RepID=UPI001F1E7903|nr:hypothetical protein [Tabrizicola rongguiensis]MCF1710270.1 hypothetical protein [Tabrizicola rongguiensis]
MRFLGLIASVLIGTAAQAATYEYDYDKKTLSLDGQVQSKIDFKLGSKFDIRFTFDDGWLSSDNPLGIKSVVHDGTRITFSPRPMSSSALDFWLSAGLLPTFSTQTGFRSLPGGSFSAYWDWNGRDCRTYGYSCAYEDNFFSFIGGYGSEPRESTYSITVSSVPVPHSVIGLASFMVALFAVGNLTRRRGRHSGQLAKFG